MLANRHDLLKLATTALLIGLVALWLLFVTGCASPAGRGSRLLPWNWFSPDRVAQLEKAESKTAAAETAAVKAAQVENAKTIEALKTAPSADRSVQVATRTANNAQLLLDQAVGPVPPETVFKLRETVAALVSENAELRATGEAAQARDERTIATQAQKLDEARAREDTLTEKLKASDLRYQAEAAQARKWKFWIVAIVGGWLALQILSGLAKFYPPLAPIARAAGAVSAPVAQAMLDKAHRAVGQAIATAEKVSSATAEQLRNHLDATTDEAEQQAIRRAYIAAASSQA